MNKRGDFRIQMFGEKMEIKNLYIRAVGKMENVSGTGMAVDLASDFFQNDVSVRFEVQEKKFERKAVIIDRKTLPSGETRYRLQFIEFVDKDRRELHSALVTLEASRLIEEK